MKNEKTTVKNQIDVITPNEQARAAFPHILKEIKKEYAEYIGKNPNEKKYFLDRYKKAIKKAEEVAAAPTLTACRVSVEWKKSRVWGYNPSVTVDAWTVDADGAQECTATTGRASGCGYDKQSAAIAEAFNASPAILKALYNADEKRLKGRESRKQSRRDFIGYGSGCSARPYFEGGCGVSVFYKIFENCGYTFEQVASGKTFDAYKITKKEKKGAKIKW